MHSVFRDPGIPDGEKSVYAVTVPDRPSRLDMISTIARDERGYDSLLEARVAGTRFAMTIRQRFRRVGAGLRAERYVAESRSGARILSREEGWFLGGTHLQIGGALSPFPGNLMPLAGALTLLRGLDFTEGARSSLELWLAFSVQVPVEALVQECVAVDVPAGRVPARQVRLRPCMPPVNMVVDKMIGGFLPPAVAHFEAAAPHRLMRLSFPTGPMLSDPRGLLELMA